MPHPTSGNGSVLPVAGSIDLQTLPYAQARKPLAFAVLAAYLAMTVCLAATTVSLDWTQTFLAYGKLAGIAVVLAYVRWRGMKRLQPAIEVLLAGLLMTIPVIVSTYAAASLAMPLADARLIAMDRAIGFDWRAFIAFVDARPLLAGALGLAYSSISYQLLVLPALLCVMGHGARSAAFVVAYGVLCLISSLVSIWYPALGTYSVYGVASTSLASIDATFGYFFLEQFQAVRHDPDFVLNISACAGIVTFPSVHAGLAFLCAWLAWDNRWTRYPALLLNAGMTVSAISHANHYLVDVLAGIVIAGFSVVVVVYLFGLSCRFPQIASGCVPEPRQAIVKSQPSRAAE